MWVYTILTYKEKLELIDKAIAELEKKPIVKQVLKSKKALYEDSQAFMQYESDLDYRNDPETNFDK